MAKNEPNLNEIYTLMGLLEKAGIALTEEQLERIAKVEDDLIRNEVLPLLIENVGPVMRQIQRELTLVLNYKPNQPISLRVSRQGDLYNLDEEVNLSPDIIPVPIERGPQYRGRQRTPAKRLRVKMPDGSVIYNWSATDTFCDVIKQIGLNRVRGLEIKPSRVNLVSTTKDPYRQQREIDGLYVFTNLSTTAKKDILERIAYELGLDMKVEVIDK